MPRQPNIVIGTINNFWQYSFSKIPLFGRENENSLIFSHFAWPKTHGKHYSNAPLHKKLAQSHPKIPFSQNYLPPYTALALPLLNGYRSLAKSPARASALL